MRILVLGGTRFLGRSIVEALIADAEDVTIVHRARSEPEGIAGATSLVFDRAEGHAPLREGNWDVAIDLSGTLPRIVADAVQALRDRVERYCYVSSISVYAEGVKPPIRETSETVAIPATLPDEAVTIEAYGAQKLLSEQIVLEAFGERAFVVRPGLIVGPRDRSDRFTYWVRRVAAGGDVLAPGRPEREVQFIDVRDLGQWIARGVESGVSGTMNATGPWRPLPMGELLARCARIAKTQPHFIWVSDEELAAAELGAWIEVPLWLPDGEDALISEVDCARAIASGLEFRPVEETIRTTLEWDRTRPSDEPLQAGIKREREREVLMEHAKRTRTDSR